MPTSGNLRHFSQVPTTSPTHTHTKTHTDSQRCRVTACMLCLFHILPAGTSQEPADSSSNRVANATQTCAQEVSVCCERLRMREYELKKKNRKQKTVSQRTQLAADVAAGAQMPLCHVLYRRRRRRRQQLLVASSCCARSVRFGSAPFGSFGSLVRSTFIPRRCINSLRLVLKWKLAALSNQSLPTCCVICIVSHLARLKYVKRPTTKQQQY